MFLMMISAPVMANDIYVTQSGATLTLDVLQDGQNNTIGNSTTASTVTGATSNFNIDQIGNSNVLTFDTRQSAGIRARRATHRHRHWHRNTGRRL